MLRDKKPFHFIKLRKIWYGISIVFLVPAIISIFAQGFNLGIDFTGGSMMEVRFSQHTAVEDVRGVMAEFGMGSDPIQRSDVNDFIIRTRELEEEESNAILLAMGEKIGEVELLRNERVGPKIGQELILNAFMAFGFASILIMLYITWRFELKQGIATVVSLLHDAILVLGIFSLLQLEVDSKFVAAILIIIGYSLNDRIVIFDRIRENLIYRKRGEDLAEVINNSIWQTMARSINTGLTMLFVVGALFVLGGSTLQNMTLAILVGLTIGIYSSLSNASPLWYDLRRMEGKAGTR